jgi:hypothetical protein
VPAAAKVTAYFTAAKCPPVVHRQSEECSNKNITSI